MPAGLPVELNRGRRHEIRVTETFEADGPFDVDLTNHGDGVHVHVGVEGDLAAVARVGETNPYVDADESATVRVDIDPVDDPVEGHLTIATGYGSEEARIAVRVSPFEGPAEVPVDEDLATPDPDAAPAEGLLDDAPPASVLAVAALAVVVAVSVAALVGSTPVIVAAGVVVVSAVALVALSL